MIAQAAFHSRFIKSLPKCSFAVAYGSSVFKQNNNVSQNNMIDYLIAVEDCVKFHEENLEFNRKHYSIFGRFNPDFTAKLQRNAAYVWFNTLVPFENRVVKYGVIERADLIYDLNEWKWLYVAGRLQKPVLMVHPDGVDELAKDTQLSNALVKNLENALTVALLLLPDSFTKEDLFVVISYISYFGDFRMKIGEDKRKIFNIVRPNVDRFFDLYEPIIESNRYVIYDKTSREFYQDSSSRARYAHIDRLPLELRKAIIFNEMRYNWNRDIDNLLLEVACQTDCQEVVKKAIEKVNKTVVFPQAVKGVFLAGVWKTLVYSSRKLKKMFSSMFRS